MAKTKEYKKELMEKYKDLISKYDGFLLVDASNIDNNTVTELKKKLREFDSEYTVVKNSIFKIALQENNLPAETIDFEGASAVVSYKEDPTVVAKALKEIQKKEELLMTRYGYVDEKYIQSERALSLAEIPTREELLAKLLGSINSPISGFVSVCNGNIAGFTRVLNGLAQK